MKMDGRGNSRASSVDARGPGATGAHQSDGAHAIIRRVQVLAEKMHYLEAGFAVRTQELEKLLASHHCYFSVVQRFRSDLVGTAGQRSTESQDFAGPRNAQGESFTVFRAHGELGSAFAQHKNAPCAAALFEQGRASWIDG